MRAIRRTQPGPSIEVAQKFHRRRALAGALLTALCGGAAAGQDPFGANNTLYPAEGDWSGQFRTSNYDYPSAPQKAVWQSGGPCDDGDAGPLSTASAPAYVDAVKQFIASDIRGAIDTPLTWNPDQVGWYNMPWGATGTTRSDGSIDPESGRESLLGSYTGQILPADTFATPRPARAFQNHAVIYYNDVAATMLARVFEDPFLPNTSAVDFPEGSIVVKVEAAALTQQEWPVLENSSISYVFRPLTSDLLKPHAKDGAPAVVTQMYFTQIVVKVKDTVAAPETGWVFMVFAYDKDAQADTVWDRAVPVGAMWGNDPEYANTFSGAAPEGQKLEQTWISPGAPAYTLEALGWGDRLSGPMDVGRRHNVVTVSGKRYGTQASPFAASSCMSCHGSAQVPFIANLYPSPNLPFPLEGQEFLFFDPGSPQWAKWFQNRAGDVPMSGANRTGITAMDYDMLLTFTIQSVASTAGTEGLILEKLMGH